MSAYRNYLLFLEDMVNAIDRILDYVQKMSFEDFDRNQMVKDAVIRNLEILGEASNKVPLSLKRKYEHIPWRKMYGLRNLISHEYFGIDYELIWDIISNYLPLNRKELKEVYEVELLN